MAVRPFAEFSTRLNLNVLGYYEKNAHIYVHATKNIIHGFKTI